ncbi:MAG: TadE/TadG family type IV pilus assembly protein [Solirubrobacteraceae bacterium]
MRKRVRRRLASERGDALISGLLTLALVILVVALAVQALAYAHARNVATAAAQEGAQTAAAEGQAAGVARARAILTVAGAAGTGMHPSVREGASVITVTVSGQAPHVFPGVDLMLPHIEAQASVPVERYPEDEAAR